MAISMKMKPPATIKRVDAETLFAAAQSEEQSIAFSEEVIITLHPTLIDHPNRQLSVDVPLQATRPSLVYVADEGDINVPGLIHVCEFMLEVTDVALDNLGMISLAQGKVLTAQFAVDAILNTRARTVEVKLEPVKDPQA